MGVPENPRAQELVVTLKLGFRVEPSPGVVEIDLAVGVESAVVGLAELIQDVGLLKLPMGLLEGSASRLEIHALRISDRLCSHGWNLPNSSA
jgi:hypothetical protein